MALPDSDPDTGAGPGPHHAPGGKAGMNKKVWLGIALSAIGIVVAIVLAKRSKAAAAVAAANAPSGYSYPVVGPSTGASDSTSGSISQLGQGLDTLSNALAAQSQAQQSAMQGFQDSFTKSLGQLTADITSQGATIADLAALQKAPPASPDVNNQMPTIVNSPGEYFVAEGIDKASGGADWLTNRGGIYNTGGSAFYGSAFTPGGSFTGITELAGGGYSVTDSAGKVQTFAKK